jgi:hypothetical protein
MKPSKQVTSHRPTRTADLPSVKVIFILIIVAVVLTFKGVEKLFWMWREKKQSKVKEEDEIQSFGRRISQRISSASGN